MGKGKKTVQKRTRKTREEETWLGESLAVKNTTEPARPVGDYSEGGTTIQIGGKKEKYLTATGGENNEKMER